MGSLVSSLTNNINCAQCSTVPDLKPTMYSTKLMVVFFLIALFVSTGWSVPVGDEALEDLQERARRTCSEEVECVACCATQEGFVMAAEVTRNCRIIKNENHISTRLNCISGNIIPDTK